MDNLVIDFEEGLFCKEVAVQDWCLDWEKGNLFQVFLEGNSAPENARKKMVSLTS